MPMKSRTNYELDKPSTNREERHTRLSGPADLTHAAPPAQGRDTPGLDRVGLAALALSVLLLSASWPVIKIAITAGAGPLWFAEGRAVFAGLTGTAMVGLLGRLRLPRRRDWPAILGVGLFQLAGFYALGHVALAFVSAGRTAVLANVATIWMVPLSILVLHEPIPARRWIAAGLGLLGVAVLMGPWAIDWHSRQVLIGNIFLLGAGLSWSIAMVTLRRFVPSLTMLELLPWCFLLASVALLPLVLTEAFGHWNGRAIAAIGFMGFLAGPLGTFCVMLATARLPAMVASLGFLATPAAGLLLSAAMLGEHLGSGLLGGAALILAGVAAAAWPARQ